MRKVNYIQSSSSATLAAASSLNAFLMRKHELKEGIEVVDAGGKVIGTSQVAAKYVSMGGKFLCVVTVKSR